MTNHAKVQDRHRVAGAILADRLAMQGMLRVGSKIDTCAEVIADTEAAAVERCCAAVAKYGADYGSCEIPADEAVRDMLARIRQAMTDEVRLGSTDCP